MSDDLVNVLRSGSQCDEDGVMCIVSRQACHEAADRIEFLKAEVAELTAQRNGLLRVVTDNHHALQRAELAEAELALAKGGDFVHPLLTKRIEALETEVAEWKMSSLYSSDVVYAAKEHIAKIEAENAALKRQLGSIIAAFRVNMMRLTDEYTHEDFDAHIAKLKEGGE